jgi:hypothetical protein
LRHDKPQIKIGGQTGTQATANLVPRKKTGVFVQFLIEDHSTSNHFETDTHFETNTIPSYQGTIAKNVPPMMETTTRYAGSPDGQPTLRLTKEIQVNQQPNAESILVNLDWNSSSNFFGSLTAAGNSARQFSACAF